MELERKRQGFDDTARQAAEHLLEEFWIIREEEPEIYQMVRERENALRTYFLEKLGYHLIVHRAFAKLEKVPACPESWMGIQSFKHTRDYGLFCCLLAYLESKNIDEQFLLSDLCEELQSLYPGEWGLDWTQYEHRKSLVRVLQAAVELRVVKLVDGDISGFSYLETHEALFEVPLVSRYYMRSYPKDLSQFDSRKQILEAEWQGAEESTGVKRRHRVYRQLMLSPVMYAGRSGDPDFLYLRNFRNRISEDIERHTSFQFELYQNEAMLTLPERKARFTVFPDNRAIADITMQFASFARRQKEEEGIPLQHDGSLCLTPADFEKWVAHCKDLLGMGWSKEYREKSLSETAKDLLTFLIDWKMAQLDKETGVVYLLPLLARTICRYPEDFLKPSKEEVNIHEQQ